jgi:predicted amidohydrolase YtcJ
LSGRRKSRRSSLYGTRPARGTRRRSRNGSSLKATLVFLNANVLTMGAGQRAEAIAIRDDRIAAVGCDGQIESLAGPSTKIIDVKGATILPGFTDCHIHLIEYGLSLRNLDLRLVRTIEELKKKVAERVYGPAKWILGRGWDQERFVEKRYPTRNDLDEASREKPVFLRRVCGHICVVNSAALTLAGITAGTPNPPGGSIDRDSSGEPTGILRENAVDLVGRLVPSLELGDYVRATLTASELALRAGLTTVHCVIGSELELRALLDLKAGSRVRLRFYVLIPVDQLKPAISLGLRTGFGDEWVRIGAVKIFTDGSLGARTAALEAPYSDDPRNQGVAIYSQQELDEIVLEAHRSGFQTAIHAIGDRATAMALHAIRNAELSAPQKHLRHRIEHASVLNRDLIKRMKDARVLASVQPNFIVSDIWLKDRLGVQRASLAYPFQSLLDAGLTIVGGSDCPVEPLTPLSAIEAATNRDAPESVAAEDAISFYTRNAAYASFEENMKGTIAPGKLADLVILDKDPRKVQPATISNIRVLMTVVGGRIAYQADLDTK